MWVAYGGMMGTWDGYVGWGVGMWYMGWVCGLGCRDVVHGMGMWVGM